MYEKMAPPYFAVLVLGMGGLSGSYYYGPVKRIDRARVGYPTADDAEARRASSRPVLSAAAAWHLFIPKFFV
jgi:hypothetical protein